jgi:predicted enzyme related to lactoylglutathione lyase
MSERKLLPGKFVWFELVTPDVKRAQAFYGEVIGWKSTGFPMGPTTYEMILTGASPDTMVGGYVPCSDAETTPHWLAYVSVEDVEATVRAVIASGGVVAEPPSDIPGVGRRARIVDPQGATLCLLKNSSGDAPDVTLAPYGAFIWNELHTPDPLKAVAFYEKAFGFVDRPVPMGPSGTYHVVSRNGVDRGGITGHLPEGGAPQWLPYVHVQDADATVARAKKLGGAVPIEPADIPGIGRFAVLRDPAGATFALLKPLPREKA